MQTNNREKAVTCSSHQMIPVITPMILSGLRVHGKDISHAEEKQTEAKFEA